VARTSRRAPSRIIVSSPVSRHPPSYHHHHHPLGRDVPLGHAAWGACPAIIKFTRMMLIQGSGLAGADTLLHSAVRCFWSTRVRVQRRGIVSRGAREQKTAHGSRATTTPAPSVLGLHISPPRASSRPPEQAMCDCDTFLASSVSRVAGPALVGPLAVLHVSVAHSQIP
jgi:hypothetical protein